MPLNANAKLYLQAHTQSPIFSRDPSNDDGRAGGQQQLRDTIIQVFGLGFRDYGLGFRVQGFGLGFFASVEDLFVGLNLGDQLLTA